MTALKELGLSGVKLRNLEALAHGNSLNLVVEKSVANADDVAWLRKTFPECRIGLHDGNRVRY